MKEISFILCVLCLLSSCSRIEYLDFASDVGNINIPGADNTPDDSEADGKVLSTYTLNSIDHLSIRSTDTSTFSFSKIAGDTNFDVNLLTFESLGTANCLSSQVIGLDSQSPSLEISSCQGNGSVSFSYDSKLIGSLKVDNEPNDIHGDIDSITLSVSGDYMYLYGEYHTRDSLMRLDIQTGLKEVVSNENLGTGSVPSNVVDLVINKNQTKCYLLEGSMSALFEIDLTNGNRRIVSDSITGSGVNLENLAGLSLNDSEDTAYVVQNSVEILSVDLTNGNRTVIANNTIGAGDAFDQLVELQLSLVNPQYIYVLDSNLKSIFKVNTSDGSRSVIVSNSLGSGQTISYPTDFKINDDESFAMISDWGGNKIVKVDLVTKDRIKLDHSIGPSHSRPSKLVYKKDTNEIFFSDVSDNIYKREVEGNFLSYFVNNSTALGEDLSSLLLSIILDEASEKIYVSKTFFGALDEVELSSGNRLGSVSLSGDTLANPSDLIMTQSKSYLFAVDHNNDAIVRIDINNGVKSIISNSLTGSGIGFSQPRNGVLNQAEDTLFVTDSNLDAIVAVDLSNGDRTVISSSSVGTGTTFNNPRGIVINDTDDTLYVVDEILDVVFSVNITTGNRTVLSSVSVGTGVMFDSGVDLVINHSDDKLILAANDHSGYLFEINLNNGNRTVISSELIGSGSLFGDLSAMSIDATFSYAYITDSEFSSIVKVDLGTGNRVIFSR